MLISAGVSSGEDCQQADNLPNNGTAKVSAVHTRNAVLFFAALGLFLIIVDTILYVTSLIHRIPATKLFELIVSAQRSEMMMIILVLLSLSLLVHYCDARPSCDLSDSGVRERQRLRKER